MTYLTVVGYSIFGWKNMSEEDFWWCIEQCLHASNWQPNMVGHSPCCVCVRGWVGGWAWSVEADILGRVVLVMEYVCDAKQTLTNSSQGATELVMYVNFFSIARPCGKLHDSTYEECGKLGSANV